MEFTQREIELASELKRAGFEADEGWTEGCWCCDPHDEQVKLWAYSPDGEMLWCRGMEKGDQGWWEGLVRLPLWEDARRWLKDRGWFLRGYGEKLSGRVYMEWARFGEGEEMQKVYGDGRTDLEAIYGTILQILRRG